MLTAIFLLDETFEVNETKEEIHELINEDQSLDIIVHRRFSVDTFEPVYIMKAQIQYYY